MHVINKVKILCHTVTMLCITLLISFNNVQANSVNDLFANTNKDTNNKINCQYTTNKQNFETAYLNIGSVNIKYIYKDNRIHYDYEDITCGNCNNKVQNIIDSLYDTKSLLNSIVQCNSCKKFFNTANIDQQNSFLYPYLVEHYCSIHLHCSNQCQTQCQPIGYIYLLVDENTMTERKIRNESYATERCIGGKCPVCNCTAVYDKEYIENQLQHMNIPHQWFDYTIYGKMNSNEIIQWLNNIQV